VDVKSFAKKLDDPETKALAALGDLKPSGKTGRVLAPFPVGEDSPYDKVIGHKSLKKRIAKAPIEKIPLSKIVTNGQKSVRVDQTAHYIGDPKSPGTEHGGRGDHDTAHPIFVKLGGKIVHYDGLHRATAAKLRGEKTIEGKLVDLEALAKKAST
jgi:hypothetical protein